MQHDPPIDPVRQWMEYASVDLAFAQRPIEGRHVNAERDMACFHAQQAAEKSIKAVLTKLGIEPPWKHNIEQLLRLLPTPPPPAVENAVELTDWAAAGRYPGTQHATDDDLTEALDLARAVVSWAEKIIDD